MWWSSQHSALTAKENFPFKVLKNTSIHAQGKVVEEAAATAIKQPRNEQPAGRAARRTSSPGDEQPGGRAAKEQVAKEQAAEVQAAKEQAAKEQAAEVQAAKEWQVILLRYIT